MKTQSQVLEPSFKVHALPTLPSASTLPFQGLGAINSGEAGMHVQGEPGLWHRETLTSPAWPSQGPIPLASTELRPRQASAYHQLHSPWLYLALDLKEKGVGQPLRHCTPRPAQVGLLCRGCLPQPFQGSVSLLQRGCRAPSVLLEGGAVAAFSVYS